jgi:hypothetical protein
MHGMCAVRAVLHIIAFEPLGGGSSRDIEDLGCFSVRQPGVLDFLPDLWGCTGLGMNVCARALECSDAVLRYMGDSSGGLVSA